MKFTIISKFQNVWISQKNENISRFLSRSDDIESSQKRRFESIFKEYNPNERIKFSSLFLLNNSKFYRNWWIEILENFIFEKYSDIFLFGSNNTSFTGIVAENNNFDSESFIEWEIKSFQKIK